MKRLLTIKGMIAVGVVALILAGSVAYAAHLVFNVNLTGSVQVSLSSDEPIQLFSEDGVTRINDGDVIDFGAAEVDFFGRGPVPLKGPFFVKNISNGPVRVVVSGDLRDDILPLFGPTPADLRPAPHNAFILPGPGEGDTVEGYLGLRFLAPSAGNKQTTITFSATEIGDRPVIVPQGPLWTPTGSMAVARRDHTATLLSDGTVLIVGGTHGSAELYDPASGVFTVLGSVPFSQGVAAARLADGRVLVVGWQTAMIYDPTMTVFTETGSLNVSRTHASATLLPDGRVLVAGGQVAVVGGPQSLAVARDIRS